MKKLLVGLTLLTTSMFATINGLQEEKVIDKFIESIGGLPYKVDKYLMQVDMFIKRNKDNKIEFVNVYVFKNNISFDENKLFSKYKQAMIKTYCEDKMLFGDDKKITIVQKYLFRGEFIKTLKLNESECK